MGSRKGPFLMFSTYLLTGTSALAAGYLAVSAMIGPQPFMTVHSISQDDKGKVTADRTVHFDPNIGDWTVTVVGADTDAPSCKTIPGNKVHQGWSPYSPGRKMSAMPLDEWVGDPGCLDRLNPGKYTEYTSWVPRDGSPIVSWQRQFTKPPSDG